MPIRELSIVLPCYNEEENIEEAVRRTAAWLDRQPFTGEIIVVNDGSKDHSQEILERLKQEIPMLTIVKLPVNQGYGIAIRSGCDAATKDTIAFVDSDGQFRIEDLGLLLPHLESYAFVTGRRRRRADPFVRNTFGKILGVMNWMAFGMWVRDVNCGMKVFRRDIWQRIRPEHGVEKLFNTELFLHLQREKIPWFQVDVPHYPRLKGHPTGADLRVIIRMFHELQALKRAQK